MAPAAKKKAPENKPGAKTKTTPVTIKDGQATVYLHRTIGSIGYDGQTIERGELDEGGRTWSFECPPDIAREIIDRYEFAAGSESGVPLTVDEKQSFEDLKSRSNIEVGKLAQALAQLGEDRVRENEAARS